MPRYIAVVKTGYVPDSVAFMIGQDKSDKVRIINIALTAKSSRTSGLILFECSQEVVERIEARKICGIRDIEGPQEFTVVGDLP